MAKAQQKDAVELLAELVVIARSQLGVEESPRGSNRGAALTKYFAADNLPGGGYAWCASFVCWCVQQWLAGEAGKRFRVNAPRTASAFRMIDWARTQSAMQVITRPEIVSGRYRVAPGDIVVFEVSHVAICVKPAPKGFVITVDGNTNDEGSREGYEVAERTRRTSTIRAVLRFIPTATEIR